MVAAQRPGLRAVAGVLIALELFAFLRSLIRFAQRLSGHRLGLAGGDPVAALGRRRRGGWSYTRWRRYASGDLLSRALTDTDELQDLWVRGLLPLTTAVRHPGPGRRRRRGPSPTGAFALDAAAFAAPQAVGVAALLGGLPGLVAADAGVRRARAADQSTLVERQPAPELLLLGADDSSRPKPRADRLR